ncbi:MAG: tail fiber domain-containing protein, partial [Proteobacteria bacterium]|nr:tail fiber domain-containing protein [Pseudomonadota bacterium]
NLLQVSSGAGKLRLGVNTSDQFLDIYRDNGSGASVYNAAQGSGFGFHVWQVASVEQMRLTSTGLGIGTSSPGAKLHVDAGSSNEAVRLNASSTFNTSINWYNAGSIKWSTQTLGDGSNAYRWYNHTASSEAMRLDSSGNLGLGVTPSAWGGPAKVIQIGSYSNIYDVSGNTSFGNNFYYDGTNSRYLNSTQASLYQQSSGEHRWDNAPSGTAGNSFTFTRAMTLNASGNLMVGTTTPTGKLTVNGAISSLCADFNETSGSPYIRVQNGTQISGLGVTTGAEPTFVGSISNHAFIFRTNNTERARIDSSGNLLVGATSFLNYGTLSSYTNAVTPAGRFVGGPSTVDGAIVLMVDKYSSTNTTSQWFLGFTIDNQGVASGVITANGASQAAFGSWSDRRLKENIVDLSPQLENICALRPVEFDYIESEGGGHQISFIAQEFEEVYPDAVGERSDGMKTLTGWDKTTARLVKAIQELKSQFDLVKAELATLKGN